MCSILVRIFLILEGFPFSRKDLRTLCLCTLKEYSLEENVSSMNYSCADCINIPKESLLCVALWELGPVQRMNRTEQSACYQTGICRMLWVCQGHPAPRKWLRVGSLGGGDEFK